VFLIIAVFAPSRTEFATPSGGSAWVTASIPADDGIQATWTYAARLHGTENPAWQPASCLPSLNRAH